MRRIGRILAFQSLYSWDVAKVSIEDLLNFSWLESEGTSMEGENESVIISDLLKHFEELPIEKKEETFIFARLLVRGTVEHIDEIDSLIKAHLSDKWQLDRINKVALAVVRFSIYTLLYQKDTSSSVVIDEAVEIVKDYGVDDSYKFTNAILDKINKEIEV